MNFVTTVENIDLTAKISDDYYDDYKRFYKEIFDDLRQKYLKAEYGEKIEYLDMFYMSGKKRYPHQLIKYKDDQLAYRIYIAENVGDNFEIFISLSAHYLHLNSLNKCIDDVKEKICEIFFIEEIKDYKISRIDICNHTSLIDSEFIKQGEENSRVVTRLTSCSTNIKLIGEYKTERNYIRYGNGSRVVRFYNKSREICEMQHKSFFIPKWYEDELIDDLQYFVFDYVYSNIENAKYNKYELLKYKAQLIYLDLNNKTELMNLYHKFIDDPNKYTIDEMIETMKNIITMSGYELVRDIYNIEFQNRSAFLKTIKVVDHNGLYIDFTNIDEINKYIKKLHDYLISTFRVISRNSNAKRKRDRKDCDVWQLLKETEINNIECDYKKEKLQLFREYQKSKEPINPTRQIFNKLIRLGFITGDKESFEDIDIEDLIYTFKNNYRSSSENFKDITLELERLKKFYK